MDILSAKTNITVDGVPGTEVLALCSTDGTITLSSDGQPLADSAKSADDNLYRMRTARAAAFECLPGLLDELEQTINGRLEHNERRRTATAAIAALRDQIGQV